MMMDVIAVLTGQHNPIGRKLDDSYFKKVCLYLYKTNNQKKDRIRIFRNIHIST